MKKILIFGVSGNIGGYAVDYFLNMKMRDFEIVGADIVQSEYIRYSKIDFVRVDIGNKEEFDKLPKEEIYAVIDLIGPMPARMIGYHPDEYVSINILGSFNIFQYAVNVHADRILYAKSFCDILKRADTQLVLHVDDPPLFDYGDYHAVYCVSQNSAMELLKCIHRFYGIKTFIFRLPHIYLWSRNDKYSVKGVPHKMMHRILIDQATEGKVIEVWGDAERKKDMVYVKDFCQILFKASFIDRKEGFYNVGTGIGISLLDQIKGIVEVFAEKRKSDIVFCPDKPNAPQYIMDIKETVEELGYAPQYGYIDMLKDMKTERKLDRF